MSANDRESFEQGGSSAPNANTEAPSIEAIQQAVAEAFRTSLEDLSARRPRLQINDYPEQVRRARTAALYLCRELTEHSAAHIAERFGRKPAVVRRAVEAVRQIIDFDLDLRESPGQRSATASDRFVAGERRVSGPAHRAGHLAAP
jgi:chromosomal replication initiation ATPase DnaA